jgi:hypothetical protein
VFWTHFCQIVDTRTAFSHIFFPSQPKEFLSGNTYGFVTVCQKWVQKAKLGCIRQMKNELSRSHALRPDWDQDQMGPTVTKSGDRFQRRRIAAASGGEFPASFVVHEFRLAVRRASVALGRPTRGRVLSTFRADQVGHGARDEGDCKHLQALFAE